MDRDNKPQTTVREILAGQELVGFETVRVTGTDKGDAPQKSSVAKTGKSAAGKLIFAAG